MTEMHFLLQKKPKKYHTWSCQNVCDALTFLLDNIFIRFGNKLYRQVNGIPMGTNCAPLVADLFLFCYERDFMMSLSDDKQADVIDAFNTTSRYLIYQSPAKKCDFPYFCSNSNQSSATNGVFFLFFLPLF